MTKGGDNIMRQSFYLFALKYRGGQKEDKKAKFAIVCLTNTIFQKQKLLLTKFR